MGVTGADRAPGREAAFAAAATLFGAITLASAAKRALEGDLAFALFWLAATPAALAWLGLRHRGQGIVIVGAAALVALTFAAGAVTGTTTGADTALGGALVVGGLAARSRALAVCGAAVAGLAIALGLAGADHAAALTTGAALVATGLAEGHRASRTQWPA